MQITIATEKRKEIEVIQRNFKKYLSQEIILKSTKEAINGTVKAAINNKQVGLKESITSVYNVKKSDLKGFAKVWPTATTNSLYAGISLRKTPITLIRFPKEQTISSVALAQLVAFFGNLFKKNSILFFILDSFIFVVFVIVLFFLIRIFIIKPTRMFFEFNYMPIYTKYVTNNCCVAIFVHVFGYFTIKTFFFEFYRVIHYLHFGIFPCFHFRKF